MSTPGPSRTLVVLRHGKSDWSGAHPDRDRPVGDRGRRQAAAAGAWLAEHLPTIDAAVVSPAQRTRTTWELVATELADPPEPVLDERLYGGWGEGLLGVVRDLPAEAASALLVGHNPGVEDLVELLTGTWVDLPTASLAVVDLEGGWREAGRATGRLRASGRPPA